MRILYLDLDALNPKHLSCYGYCRSTSPTIDALAARGVRCTNVYASDAPCLPSRTAFYSGRHGIHTGVVGHSGTAADPKPQGRSRGFKDWFTEQGLATRLTRAGYHTAMISPFGDRHSAHHFYAGFREIHNTGKSGGEVAFEVQPVVERWLDQNAADDNWYLHLNYWDIHTPYRTPLDYGDPMEGQPLPAFFTDEVVERHMKRYGPHSAMDLGMYGDDNPERFPRTVDRIDSMAKLRKWIDAYDTAIHYVDTQVKAILDRLESAGVLDDTLIVVSADHGENQGALGIYGEHATADEATCNIPMIVAGPGVKSGVVDEGLHYNLDFAPTLMDILGQEACPVWDGQSYAATLTEGADTGRDDLVVSQCCHVCQRSVRFGDWIYIRTYHDGLHPFPQEMLFNLEDDPYEQDNVAESNPELCREGAWRLSRWHDAQMQKMVLNATDVVDPLWTVMREGGPEHAGTRGSLQGHWGGLQPYLDRLEATGRAAGAAELRERHPEYLEV
ncbi:MAG: sulfatase [Planctomycetota bacterium]